MRAMGNALSLVGPCIMHGKATNPDFPCFAAFWHVPSCKYDLATPFLRK